MWTNVYVLLGETFEPIQLKMMYTVYWCLVLHFGGGGSLDQALFFAHHRSVDAAVPSLAETRDSSVTQHPRDTHGPWEPSGATRTLHPVFRLGWITWRTSGSLRSVESWEACSWSTDRSFSSFLTLFSQGSLLSLQASVALWSSRSFGSSFSRFTRFADGP